MTKEPKHLNNICDIHCPFLKEYEHPYYGISAWCDKTHKEIPLYDNEYISICKGEENDQEKYICIFGME